MGWATGTDVFLDIYRNIRKYIPEKNRIQVVKEIMEALMNADWDCLNDVEGEWPEVDAVIAEIWAEEYM